MGPAGMGFSPSLLVTNILANVGGVTVFYFEWVQNPQKLQWSEEEIYDRLKRILKEP